MEIEKMLEIILVALACPICIPLILEDDKSEAEKILAFPYSRYEDALSKALREEAERMQNGTT